MKRLLPMLVFLILLWPQKAQAQSTLVNQYQVTYAYQATDSQTGDLLRFEEDVIVQIFFEAVEVDPVVGGYYVCGWDNQFESDLWFVFDLTQGNQILDTSIQSNIFDGSTWAGCFFTSNYGTADRRKTFR